MFASPIETGIAPSGSLLGLLQRGRGDGWLHALAAPRAQAVAALEQCVLHDPRQDWRLEHRSLYYARLYVELDAGLDGIAAHLADPEDALRDEEERTGLALSVLGHLASYGNAEALRLLRRYAIEGANWRWALDELAVRDDDAGLRALGPEILARFPATEEGEAALTAAVRDSFEPRPWHIWAADPARPGQRARLERALEDGDFDRWQRQLRPPGPQPGWSVRAVLDWAREGYEQTPRQWREAPAARCLAAVAGPEDRPELLAAAAGDQPAARAAALRHLAERGDPEVFPLIRAGAAAADPDIARSAVTAFSRMRGPAALAHARRWAPRQDELGACAAAMLAERGEVSDAPLVLTALLRAVRTHGSDARELRPLVEGAGRLAVTSAAPVLRHIYRETSSSHLRGHAARALAATDPSFAAGFAIECLWDCEEDTREVAARFATTVDSRVVERLRRLATDPAERAGVQTAVRGRLADRAVG
ncbi:HEAT repeat domain-containing protein [Streptomyces litchfieldiae]|uniref:HEAT repeat domain-containing protein n=1 Tax=Streptomyces litchfieldiae TaxID=3075543 RepID=A0ABU2MT88_9ACTN|nr:HEAT repeat domain-containing protein [Streptomyces sp. DSM 44938]MDT0343809.1 HEAT repeat domain-containing protein [Streptomyces sp. DSM 44938]